MTSWLSSFDSLLSEKLYLLFTVVNKETISMVVSRQFVTDIVIALDNLNPSLVKEVALAILNIVQSRLISYEEQVILTV